jgi:hypothetical protein
MQLIPKMKSLYCLSLYYSDMGLKNLSAEDKMTTDVFVLCHTIKDMLRLELIKESLRICLQITYALQPRQDCPHSAFNTE